MQITKKKKLKSLAVTLSIMVSLVCFFSVIFTNGIGFFIGRVQLNKFKTNSFKYIAQSAASNVDDYIVSKLNILKTAVFIGNLENGSNEARRKVIERLLENEPDFRQIILIDQNGKLATAVSRLIDTSSRRLYEQICTDSSILQLKDFIIKVKHHDETDDKSILQLGVPLSGDKNSFKGVLVTELNMQPVWEIIKKIKVIDENNQVYIIDKKGNLIHFQNAGSESVKKNLQSVETVRKFINIQPVQNEIRYTVTEGISGKKATSVCVAVKSPDWALVVETPKSKLNINPLSKTFIFSAVFLFFMILLFGSTAAILISIHLSRIITRPLKKLRDSVSIISKGNLNYKIEETQFSEIAELADSFNQVVKWVFDTTVSRDTLIKEISNRKQAEENLKKSEERFRDIALSIGDWIWESDDRGLFSYCSDGAEKILGYKKEEMIGKSPFEYTPPEMMQKTLDAMRKYVNNKEAFKDFEHWSLKKDGSKVCILTSGVPVFDEQGNLKGYRGVDKDITDRKKIELELQKAKIIADSASKAKSEFLANMSHEIRTPMTAVIGFSELLKNTQLTPEQKDYVETINTSGEMLLSLINDILDFSKIEAEHLTLESIDFDLEYLIASVLKIARQKLINKNIDLTMIYSINTPRFFKGDPTRLRQILLNLVNNAVKFTSAGEIVVNIHDSSADCKDKVEQVHNMIISVKDTGIGIPEEKQEIIFNPFEQADSSTTRKYGGTGLGLAITRKLVERMGGSIQVISEVSKGSEFIVSLQLPPGSPESRENIEPVDLRNLIGKRVVIVDDNDNTRKLLYDFCTRIKMQVIFTASMIIDAFDWLTNNPEKTDVVLSDIMLPEIDGFEFARMIRRKPEFNAIKLIALSSDATPYSSKKSSNAGFDAYLSKPIFFSDLCNVLQVVFGDKRASKQPIVTNHMAHELGANRRTVLVVEDNIINQKLLKILLTSIGYRVEPAFNGKEALELLKKRDFSVILMDLQMPVMGGLEASEKIRKDLNIAIPIIALTAHVTVEDETECKNAGMNDFLIKPVDASKLKDKLNYWSENQKTEFIYDNSATAMKELQIDRPTYNELLNEFVDQTKELISVIESALKNSEFNTVKEHIHTIKGVAGNLRLDNCFKIAENIYNNLKTNNTSSIETQIADLKIAVIQAGELIKN